MYPNSTGPLCRFLALHRLLPPKVDPPPGRKEGVFVAQTACTALDLTQNLCADAEKRRLCQNERVSEDAEETETRGEEGGSLLWNGVLSQ